MNKIASILSYAQRYYYQAWNIASNYFANEPSGITEKIKTEILSFSFLKSLVFDVLCNMKLAKYNVLLVERQEVEKFGLVIGYEKKASRVLELALGNKNVEELLGVHLGSRKELLGLREELLGSLGKNLQKNSYLYHQPEIAETELPPADALPPEMNITLTAPANLILDNEGEFAKLISPESSKLALELLTFARSRKSLLDTSFKKLNDEIAKIFMTTGISFYLDDDDSRIRRCW